MGASKQPTKLASTEQLLRCAALSLQARTSRAKGSGHLRSPSCPNMSVLAHLAAVAPARRGTRAPRQDHQALDAEVRTRHGAKVGDKHAPGHPSSAAAEAAARPAHAMSNAVHTVAAKSASLGKDAHVPVQGHALLHPAKAHVRPGIRTP